MDNKESANTSNQSWISCFSAKQTGGHRYQNHHRVTKDSDILNIERAERAKRSSLTQHADRLYASFKARDDAVLERLGLSVQKVILPLPKTSATPSREKNLLRQGGRLTPLSEEPPRRLVKKENDSFSSCKELHGSQIHSSTVSSSSVTNLSSADTHTPDELRAITLFGSPVDETPVRPPAAQPLRRTESHLPVYTELPRADRKTVKDVELHTTKNKVGAILETLKNFQAASSPSHKPQTLTKTTAEMRATQPGKLLQAVKMNTEAGKKTDSDCSLNKVKDIAELQPLANPAESLSNCFTPLSSDDWKKKINCMKTIRALAQHHAQTLKTKLHEVCLLLIEEVNNLRSAVACEAMDTIAELYVQFQKAMDPEVELTGRALLLKLAKTTNVFIHQQANLALDAMVENCSHGRTVSALLNTGLSHRCNAVRGSTALHLQQVANKMGADRILSAGRSFSGRFLTAVSKMSVDAAPAVRHHGQIMLKDLSLHSDFLHLWTKIVPEKERRPLQKILKPAAQFHPTICSKKKMRKQHD